MASSKIGDEVRDAKAAGDFPQLLGGSNLSSSSSSSGDEDGANHSNSDGSVAGGTDSEFETIDVEEPVSVGSGYKGKQCAPLACEVGSSAESEDADDSDSGNAADGLVNGLLNPDLRVPQVAIVNKGDFLPKMELPISPQGRLMQPVPTVCFCNLLEDLQYAVWISFIQDSGHCAGEYMHPDSPMPGSRWNGQPVSFSRLKLYAFDGIRRTPISLVYNRNYFLQINFGNVNEAGHILKSTVIRQGIVGTWFVAVPYNKSSSKKHS